MVPTGEAHHFSGELPQAFSQGNTVEYKLTAKDVSVATNMVSSEWFNFIIGYEDYEGGLHSWQTESGGWDLDIRYIKSGKNSAATFPGAYYPPNQDISLTSRYGVDLSEVSKAGLFFQTIYFIEEDKDFGYIEVSSDSGNSWERLDKTFTGTSPWKEEQLSLSKFTGTGYNDVRIRFRFISDSTQAKEMVGWIINDIRILPNVEVSVPQRALQELQSPTQFALDQNYPNPFNPRATVEYDLPESARVRLAIYDVLGRYVRTLVDSRQAAGYFHTIWDGTNERGAPVAAGVYFCRMEANDFVPVIKLVLVRY